MGLDIRLSSVYSFIPPDERKGEWLDTDKTPRGVQKDGCSNDRSPARVASSKLSAVLHKGTGSGLGTLRESMGSWQKTLDRAGKSGGDPSFELTAANTGWNWGQIIQTMKIESAKSSSAVRVANKGAEHDQRGLGSRSGEDQKGA